MLRFSFCTLVVVFFIKGFMGEVLLNWVLPLIPVLLMFFAMRMRWSPSNTLIAGTVQIGLLIVLIYPYALGLSMKQDPLQKIRGWDRVVEAIAERAGPTEVVTTEHYSTLAWALYFWPSDLSNDRRYLSPTGQVIPSVTRRRNQYDNWDVLNQPYSSLVHIGQYSEQLATRCLEFRDLGEVSQVMPDGTIRSTLNVFHCLGFSPDPPWPLVNTH
jgi:hypothetical protein